MLSSHSSSEAVLTQQPIPGQPRERRVHLPGDAVLDGDDVRQLSDSRAELRAHQVSAVGVAPHRDPDLHRLADRAVVVVEEIVAIGHEVQHRRVHDHVVGTDRLGVAGKRDDRVQVLVRAGT